MEPSKARFIGRIAAHALDRRWSPRWIAGAGLALLVTVVAACSGGSEVADSSSEAQSAAVRWTLPDDVKAAGALVHIPYVNAPKWTTASACAGELDPGSHVLGEFLMDKFAQVSSVGGYSCRKNTADATRMSVHGTGRALDVFIPEVKGDANSAQGDKVANWLVENATNVGVQLIIWDRSMWRANGTNDVPYGGPIPHIDHIHVELTEASAANTSLWFTDPDGGAGDSDAATDGDDGGDSSADAGTDTDWDDDAGDPDNDWGDDAGLTPTPDAAVPTPAVDASTPATADSGADESGDEGQDSADDAPGAQNSLPDRPETRPTPSLADEEAEIKANAGCSAAPSQSPLGSAGLTLGFAMGLGIWLRKKKKR